MAQLRRYQELQRQMQQYERTREELIRFLQRPVFTDWYAQSMWRGPVPSISSTEYQQAKARLSEVDRNISLVTRELAPLQDKQGNFQVDAFALGMNETVEGLPVFDYGSPQPAG